MTRCLAPDCRMGGVGCDNMTVIIVCLLQGEDYSELCNKCARASASSLTAGNNLVKERSVNMAQDVDDDEEWFDCTDEELPPVANDITGNSNNSNDKETFEAVEQDDEVMRLEDGEKHIVTDETVSTLTQTNNDRQHDIALQSKYVLDKEETINSQNCNGDNDNSAAEDGAQLLKSTAI